MAPAKIELKLGNFQFTGEAEAAWLEKQLDKLVLLASCPGKVEIAQLREWTETKNLAHFKKTLRALHKGRMAEVSENATGAELLPPGSIIVAKIVATHIGG